MVGTPVHKERIAIFVNLGMLEFLYRFQTFKDYSLSSLVPFNQYQNINKSILNDIFYDFCTLYNFKISNLPIVYLKWEQ